MKATIITLLFILLAIVLIVGNVHWDKSKTTSTNNITDSSSKLENSINQDYYISLAESWPEEAKKQLATAIKNNETYHILLLGSESIGDSDLGLLTDLRESLSNAYDEYVSLETMVYDKTSSNFVLSDEIKNLVDKKPNMIIFEPFLLNDNNVVDINTTLANVSIILEDTTSELPNATLLLQPANPIYNAKLYPNQVAALKDYAESKNITYLDHWKNWPEGNNIEILDFINQNGTPNKKGYEIWSNYITDFLVTK